MNNIKIGKLLMIGFIAPIIAILIFVWISMSKMDEINQQSTVISENWLPSVQLVESINTQTADLRNNEAVHIISTNAQTIAESTRMINKIKGEIEFSVQSYKKLVSSSEEQSLVNRFDSQYQKYLTIQNELLALSEENKNEAAKAMFLSKSLSAYQEYSNTLLKLSKLNEEGAQKSSDHGDVIYSDAITEVILTVILLIIGILAIAFVISRNMVSTIVTVQNAMIKMSEGDMTARIKDLGTNELGLLASCFNKTAETMSSITNQLISVANGVSSSSETLASTMSQADTNSQNVLMQVEQAAAAVNEMSSTATEISRNATDAEKSTVEAKHSVKNGYNSLEASDTLAN